MITPKGTKPNTQHRVTVGRYTTYEEASRAKVRHILLNEGVTAAVKRVGDHFTLRIDSRKKTNDD